MPTQRCCSTLPIAANLLPAGISGDEQIQLPPEAVMERTWQLMAGDTVEPRPTDWLLAFDSNGDLAPLKCTILDGDTDAWTDPSASTGVDEDQLLVSVPLPGNGFISDRTLDSVNAQTSATGFVRTSHKFGASRFRDQRERRPLSSSRQEGRCGGDLQAVIKRGEFDVANHGK